MLTLKCLESHGLLPLSGHVMGNLLEISGLEFPHHKIGIIIIITTSLRPVGKIKLVIMYTVLGLCSTIMHCKRVDDCYHGQGCR